VRRAGVTLGAGAAHVWDLAEKGARFTFSGDSCLRMICTDRGGAVLSDDELAPSAGSGPSVPGGTEMVTIQSLGALATGTSAGAPGYGAITVHYAPAGHVPAVGWQSPSTLLQIGPCRFAARGATVRVPRASASQRNGQQASYGTVRAADALAGQVGVETLLPSAIDVVIIALDLSDPSASESGDLALGFTGGTLVTPPQRVLAGNRRLLLYDVATRDAGDSFTVSVASAQGWTVGAVIGMHGRAVELAGALQGGIPDGFVPEGPLAPGGSLTVTYSPGGTP
jgi:hypothetical protein